MNPASPMTREELLELAALDVYGLLDDYEAALYTRSFHHAPATVQDEVLRLQAEIAADEALLPDEAPELSLRQQVLDAVAGAIERESSDLRPLATIGRTHPAAGSGAVFHRPALGRSGQFWRAAAFVLMATAVLMGYFFFDAKSRSDQILDVVLREDTERQLSEVIGADFQNFLNNPSCVRIVLTPESGGESAMATVFANPRTNEVFVLAMGLPSGADYEFGFSGEDEAYEPVRRRMRSNGTLAVLHIEDAPVTALLAVGTSMQISRGGRVILSQA